MNNKMKKKWLAEVRVAGLSNKQITEQLKTRGYTDGQISNLLNPKVVDMEVNETKLRGKELLNSDKKLKLFQKIILSWLGVYLLLKLIIGVIFTISVNPDYIMGFLVVYGLLFVLPSIIILIGLIRVKIWAYFLYMVALFFTILPTGLPKETVPIILTMVQLIGSLVIFVLTIKLYNKLFPSRKLFQR